MTVALVLLVVEVLVPAARRLLKPWGPDRNRRPPKHFRGSGRPPQRD
jgi:hypothetical protein